MSAKGKTMPSLRRDAEAEKFVDTAELSQFDLSGFKPMRFEVARKEAAPNMRLPAASMDAVCAKAAAAGIPYARYIRMLIEADLALPSR